MIKKHQVSRMKSKTFDTHLKNKNKCMLSLPSLVCGTL